VEEHAASIFRVGIGLSEAGDSRSFQNFGKHLLLFIVS
jgi:hypothetical protein